MSEPLLPKRFLFRFAIPCLYREPLWGPEGARLPPEHRLVSLAELEGNSSPVEVRGAWSEAGLAFTAIVTGKQQPPWCRESRAEDSDSVQFWIDTRDVHNVHRATRYCHNFWFLPGGAGRRLDEPLSFWMPINRAKDLSRAVQPEELGVRCRRNSQGYELDAFLPVRALTGYDPHEHPRLGFTYAVLDRELGEQTLTVGGPMPYQEDPSLWATLELVKE